MSATRRTTLLWQLGAALMGMQVIVAIVLASYGLGQVKAFNYDRTGRELERIGPLVAERLRPLLLSGEQEELRALAAVVAAETDLRVTIVDAEGTVLADTASDPAQMGTHRFWEEVDAAMATGTGAAARVSSTLGIEMMYFAQRIGQGGAPVGVVRVATRITAVDAQLGRLVRAIGLAGLALFLLTLGVIYVVSRRTSAAVAHLADAASHFAEGDFRFRVQRPRSRELSRLADSLNHMAEQLGAQLAEVQRQRNEQRTILRSMSNGTIALDLDRRLLSVNRAAEKILQFDGSKTRGLLLQEVVREPALHRFVDDAIETGARTREDLEIRTGTTTISAVSQPLLDAEERQIGLLVVINDITQLRRLESIRSDFAANVSHELRTPITNVKGYIETLDELGFDDVEQAQGFVDIIKRNANRLEAIIEDLLSLAQLEQTETREALPLETVVLRWIVEAALDHTAERRAAKSMRTEIDIDPDLRLVAAPRLIEQAITNLLSNAINYSRAGTTIRMTAREDGEDTVIEVIDCGPGIAARHLPRLFERFYRVDQARSRSLGGTGLGLAIVKHIALIHGGRAEVESVVGVGSTFRLVLPRSEPDGSAT